MNLTKNGTVKLSDIKAASEKLAPYVKHTPIIRAEKLDKDTGCQVYFKPECLQKTGSFKLRGATNKILSLSDEERAKGIIASSSGNHGLGVACASQLLGVKATLVLPVNAPKVKIDGAKSMGANVILHGYDSIERYKKLYEIQAEEGYTLVHSYDDIDLIAGQGTVGYEIGQDLSDVNTVIVPLGGGGLLAGVATALKEMNPAIRVIGAEPQAIPRYSASRAKGEPVEVPMNDTVADGLMITKTGANTYPLIQKYVDEVIPVEDKYILQAMERIYFDAKLVVEPSAAIGLAALLSGQVKVSEGEKVCCVLTGGNIDKEKLVKLFGKGEK